MRLIKDILAITFNGMAELFDRLAMACEDKSEDYDGEQNQFILYPTNGSGITLSEN